MTDREKWLERLRSIPSDRRALLMQLLAPQVMRSAEMGRIQPAARNGPIPQSFAQQRLWYLDRIRPGDPSYNMPECVRLTGSVDAHLLRRCANRIVERHEILRTTFASDHGQPVQLIHPHLELDVELVDLTGLPACYREQEARRLLFVHSELPFDLTVGPLARLTLFRLGDLHHFLLLNLHHIVSDGWSTGVFIREFITLYEAELTGRPAELPVLSIQYADYAVWQRHMLSGDAAKRQMEYWASQLSGVPDIQLPLSRARPPIRSLRGGFQSISASKALVERLKEVARTEGATLFIALAAAFKTLLHRYSGQEDITFGTPIAGRSRPELEPLIGLLANTAALRTRVSGRFTFREALRQERTVALNAYQAQTVPFEKIVERVQPDRNLSRNPIFQVMFILQNTPMPPLQLPGLQCEMLAAGTLSVKFDLLFELYETPHGLDGWMGYSADLFEEPVMARLATRYLAWLQAIVDNPERPIGTLPLDSEPEVSRLLEDFNGDLA